MAPFMGIVMFVVFPRLNLGSALGATAMSMLGQIMLWRYFFRG